MLVTISGHQYRLTPAVRRFVNETLVEPVEAIHDKEGCELEVHLSDLRGSKGGVDKECRAVLHVVRGPKIVITEISEDMRTSIHRARGRLLRRMKAFRGQRQTAARRHRKHFLAKVLPKELARRAAGSREVPHAGEVHG